jgi:hypothetical protein
VSAAVRTQVADLLEHVARRYAGTPQEQTIRAAAVRLHEPLRVAIAGRINAGKSTLLNALVGERLAPTDAGECTRIVTWYRDGLTYRVIAQPVDGAPVAVPFRRGDDALAVDLQGRDLADVRRLVVEWPSARLRSMTLIDTPGLGSLSADLSARTQTQLAPDDQPGEADAVCYLMRHLHAADARFLEAFHQAAGATPMHAVGVLSRADEIGVGRLSALEAAGRIARRYRTDPRVRRLCQTVVPVAGLLAQTAVTLREDEYAALAVLSNADRAVVQDMLLSTDRFTAGDADVDLGADVRRALVERFGLFGVRMALIRSRQAPDAPTLAAGLRRRSGIETLRELLATRFAARADLLKARTGLAVISSVLRDRPLPDDDIARAVERIVAGTHAFAEARLLDAVRAGAVPLDDAAAAEAERLLGGHGDTPAARLGLDDDAGDDPTAGDRTAGDPTADVAPAVLAEAAGEALARWRRRADHPLADRGAVEAARLVVRSCEALVVELRQRVAVDT